MDCFPIFGIPQAFRLTWGPKLILFSMKLIENRPKSIKIPHFYPRQGGGPLVRHGRPDEGDMQYELENSSLQRTLHLRECLPQEALTKYDPGTGPQTGPY